MMTTESLLRSVPSHARGLSILLVDSDTPSLRHVASLLEQHSFKVTPVNVASDALKMVNKKKTEFNLVMANLEKADIESVALICPLLMNNTPFICEFFRSLELQDLLLIKDFPVIHTEPLRDPVFSYEGEESAKERSLADEVTYYSFKKPVALEDLKDIWQHAFSKRTYQKEVALMKEPPRPVSVNRGSDGSNLREKTDDVFQQVPSTYTMLLIMDGNNISGPKPMKTNNNPCEYSNIVNPEVCPNESNANTGSREVAKKGKEPVIIREYPGSVTFIPEINKDDAREGPGVTINDENNVNPEVCPRGSVVGTMDTVMNKGKEPLMIGEYLGSEAFRPLKRINEKSDDDKGQGKRPRINHGKADSSVNDNIATSCTGNKSRPRTVWSSELHRKFMEALTALGDKNARPKKILKMMNVRNLTQRQVGSHLQKFRAQVQRICENGEINFSSPSPSVTRSGATYGGSEPSQWIPPHQFGVEGFGFRSKADANNANQHIHVFSENVSSHGGISSSSFTQSDQFPFFSPLTGKLPWPYDGYDHDQLQGNLHVPDQQNEEGNWDGTTHDHQNYCTVNGLDYLPSTESNQPLDTAYSNGVISAVFPEVGQMEIDPPGFSSFLGTDLPESETIMPFVTTSTTVMPCEGEGQLSEATNFSKNIDFPQEAQSWSEIFDSSSTGYLPNQESPLNFGTDIPNQTAHPYGCTGQAQTTGMNFPTGTDMNQLPNPPNDASPMVFSELAGNTESCQLDVSSLQGSTSQTEFPTAFTSTMSSTTFVEVEGNMYILDFADEQGGPQYQIDLPLEMANSTVVSMPSQLGQLDHPSNFAGSLDQGKHAHFWTESSVATNENPNHFASMNEPSAKLDDGKQEFSQLYGGEASSKS